MKAGKFKNNQLQTSSFMDDMHEINKHGILAVNSSADCDSILGLHRSRSEMGKNGGFKSKHSRNIFYSTRTWLKIKLTKFTHKLSTFTGILRFSKSSVFTSTDGDKCYYKHVASPNFPVSKICSIYSDDLIKMTKSATVDCDMIWTEKNGMLSSSNMSIEAVIEQPNNSEDNSILTSFAVEECNCEKIHDEISNAAFNLQTNIEMKDMKTVPLKSSLTDKSCSFSCSSYSSAISSLESLGSLEMDFNYVNKMHCEHNSSNLSMLNFYHRHNKRPAPFCKFKLLSPISDKSLEGEISPVDEKLLVPKMEHETTINNVPWLMPKLRHRLSQNSYSSSLKILGSDSGISIVSHDNSTLDSFGSHNKPPNVLLPLGSTEHLDDAVVRRLSFDQSSSSLSENSTSVTTFNPGSIQLCIKGNLLKRRSFSGYTRPKMTLEFGVTDDNSKTFMFNDSNSSISSKNFLSECHDVDPEIPLEGQPWYHGLVTKFEAEMYLLEASQGTYLVRSIDYQKNNFVLSIRCFRGYMHLKITGHESKSGFNLANLERSFKNIPGLVHHYTINTIPIPGAEHLCLRLPFECKCIL